MFLYLGIVIWVVIFFLKYSKFTFVDSYNLIRSLLTILKQYLYLPKAFLFLPILALVVLQSCSCESPLEKQINKNWYLANKSHEDRDHKTCIVMCNRIDSLASLNPEKFADYLIAANALAASNTGVLYKQWNKYIERGEQALSEYESYLKEKMILRSKVWIQYERCRYLDSLGDVGNADGCYSAVWLSLPKKHSDDKLTAFRSAIPMSIAESLLEIGDYKKAQHWLDIVADFLDQSDKYYIGKFYNLKGQVNQALSNWEQAERRYMESSKVYDAKSKKGQKVDNHYLFNVIDQSNLYLLQNRMSEALGLLIPFKDNRNRDLSNIGNVLLDAQLAKVHLFENKTQETIKYSEDALQNLNKINSGQYYYKGQIQYYLGSALAKQNRWKSSLDTIQSSLYHLSKDFTKRDWQYNPDLRSSTNKLDLLNNLILKGEILQQYAKASEQPHLLKWSLATYQKCIDLIKILRVDYGDDKVKEYLSKKSFPVFENALAVANQLYDIHEAAEYLEAAFAISETSKALSLLENLKDVEAKKIANLPDNLIQKEQQLKRQIASLELKISNQKEGDHKIVLNQILTKTQGGYDALLERFKKEYKEYYELKYDVTPISIQQVQASLNQEETFIEYFFGDHHLYTFVLTKDSKEIHIFPISDELIARIEAFRKSISTRTSLNSKTSIKKFQQISYQLYKDLLQPLDIQTTRLQIIPDGPLHGIPFAALVVDTCVAEEPYELPFLILNKTIQYNFSASVQFQHQQKAAIQEVDKKVLVIAPASFPNDSRLSLDATTVAKRFGDQFHIKTDPSKSEVLALLAEGYETVLFFTHAAADEFPYIQLYKDTLYLKEIYAAPVATNVIFLSACETGVGENQKGEGVLSTGRGFAYQGVPNTIMTLWKVQDSPTMAIALDFIKYSKIEEAATAVALRQAQLNYLQKPGQGSPFFWAGFVHMGSE